MPLTLAQAVQLSLPFLVGVFTLVGVPLLVQLMRLLEARIGSLKSETWQALAFSAVHAIEQSMAPQPSTAKKRAATDILLGLGVPAQLTGVLIEAAVHSMNTAASEVLALAPTALVPVARPPSSGSAASGVETPAEPPRTQPY